MRSQLLAGLAVVALLVGGCADAGTGTDVPTGGGSSSCVEDSVVHAATNSLPTFLEQGRKIYTKGDPCATLSWAPAQPIGATGSSPWTVLFFHDNAYLGTATQNPSAFTDVAAQTDDTVTVSYKWLRDGESTAGVSGGPALIRYRWNGSSVDMLDQLPQVIIDQNGPIGYTPAVPVEVTG